MEFHSNTAQKTVRKTCGTKDWVYLNRPLNWHSKCQSMRQCKSSYYKMKFTIVLLACVFHSITLHATNPNEIEKPRIVGGRVCSQSQPHKFMVLITKNLLTKTVHCGGSLINEYWILTASHCLPLTRWAYVIAGISTNDLRYPSWRREVRRIAAYHKHPYFDKTTFENDIGLIRVRIPIRRSSTIEYVNLPRSPKNISEVCPTVLVMGWGFTDSDTKMQASRLMCVSLDLISVEECRSLYGDNLRNVFCTMTRNKDACQGDSGGPMLCGDVQEGVVSWGWGVLFPTDRVSLRTWKGICLLYNMLWQLHPGSIGFQFNSRVMQVSGYYIFIVFLQLIDYY